ncbi:riboflavin synthase alpha chain [Thalassoporum mexicanum PCC 7367]|uniref:riboflavin synthase n=1 Tax=Thalassoporum mexicanum TaxID=3457544 RepID=UPI00029F8736|nr:riboflavin synthase [Pseudanabaena sp. PCC 7367]AFY71507.1 riboflavin synthase alpha chain [Pseudanabaena sp. PCC 7367]
MFTGLIQAIGQIEQLSDRAITICCPPAITSKLAIGDSVAVNGICLTVVEILPMGFTADISPETLSRSNLQEDELRYVNLETALAVGDKLGGHFVSGHIDGMGMLQEVNNSGHAWELSFTAKDATARYVVYKGSISINGVSLTIANCNEKGTWFKVAVIPHTYEQTNLNHLKPGNSVNLEGDLLGKYVEKFLRYAPNPDRLADFEQGRINTYPGFGDQANVPEISTEFLAEHGWL